MKNPKKTPRGTPRAYWSLDRIVAKVMHGFVDHGKYAYLENPK